MVMRFLNRLGVLICCFGLFLCLGVMSLAAQKKIPVYLIPGQGGDYRLFNNLELAPEFEARPIRLVNPESWMDFGDYAKIGAFILQPIVESDRNK